MDKSDPHSCKYMRQIALCRKRAMCENAIKSFPRSSFHRRRTHKMRDGPIPGKFRCDNATHHIDARSERFPLMRIEASQGERESFQWR